MFGGLGQDTTHGNAALLQPPDQVERLVGGDAAADDQQHAFDAGRNCRAARGFRRRGTDRLRRLTAVLVGCRAQNRAHLVLDRTPAARRPQPQQLLQTLVELPDCQ